nr:hypothetical protein [Liquorilactobacillus sucicola]
MATIIGLDRAVRNEGSGDSVYAGLFASRLQVATSEYRPPHMVMTFRMAI